MAERSNALVLKTGDANASTGSNPVLSAKSSNQVCYPQQTLNADDGQERLARTAGLPTPLSISQIPHMIKIPQALEMVAVDDLIPYVNNAKIHSDEQITQIASSIKEFGFNAPILIDEDNGVVAGHGRLLASKKLGMKDVPVVRLSHLTDAQRRAYILADNRLGENADWDDDLLKSEIERLQTDEINVELLGWDSEEIESILNGWDSNIEEPDVSDAVSTTTKLTYRVDNGDVEFAKETIENALQQVGIDYEYS